MEELVKILLKQTLEKKKKYSDSTDYIKLNNLDVEINILELILLGAGHTQYVMDLENKIK